MSDARSLVNLEELDRFEENVTAFLNNEVDAERFQSMRLQQGVYGQRQEGVNMVRVKLPGGAMAPDQLDACADLVEEYSQHDRAHITTRQDIQIHYVPLEKTPAALKRLAAAGLTTREACNNTVRNVSACPLAGVCPQEHTDVMPFLDGAVHHFLRHPLTQHLPRKFKISFSGCEADCAQGMMHDLGVVATIKDGRPGFKILAGGGLGHKPREAITVAEFVEEKDLLASMEAVITIHNRYSDRKKRAKSRIKFLVERFGAEGFIEKYREEFERTQTALADKAPVRGDWRNQPAAIEYVNPGSPRAIMAQKQPGLNVFPIAVPIGDLTAAQMRGIGRIMRDEGLAEIRTTQDQNLMILHVGDDQIARIRSAIEELGFATPQTGDNVVACPGTSTCRLGITASKIIGAKLSGGKHDLRIRASGCHNGCAQPETGDIGIYGEAKRLHGKLIPHYQMYIGGNGCGNGALAIKGPTIPSARIEQAVTRIQDAYSKECGATESFFSWSHKQGADYFSRLLDDIKQVAADQVSSLLHDHGDEAAFKVYQFGGGECSGAAQETVAANFAEAANERNYRDKFLLQRKYSEAVECANEVMKLVGQSLLFLSGQKSVDSLDEMSALLRDGLPSNQDLSAKLSAFAAELQEQKQSFDETAFRTLTASMDSWTVEAAAVCQNIDRQLDLSASIPSVGSVATQKKTAAI